VAILVPPYNASASELDEIVDKFAEGLKAALGDVGAV